MTNVCNNCRHCRKPTDMPERPITWGCAGVPPYSETPATINPQTGTTVPGRVVLQPCVWQNPDGNCPAYEQGAPGSTGDVAHVLPMRQDGLGSGSHVRAQPASAQTGHAEALALIMTVAIVITVILLRL